MIKFTSLTQRFAVWFTLVSFLPILVIGNTLLHTFENEIKKSAILNVSAIADKKIEQIDSYLKERLLDASLLRDAQTTHEAIINFTKIFEENGVDSDDYRQLDANYRANFRRFAEEAKYYDLFLISPKGDIVYSNAHERDFPTNLYRGPYRDTGLGKVARYVLEKSESNISDFEFYGPSNNAIAAFVGTPVIVNGELKGVLACQIYSERVFEVIANNVGLPDSGETVVVRLENDRTALIMAPLKSDPEAALRRKIPLNELLPSESIQKALNGKSGGGLTLDYLGKEVVAAWRYLPRMKWGIVVHIDVDEAFSSVYKVHFVGLVLLALTLLGALLGAVLFNRRVVIPLKNLNQSALEICAGNLHQRVAIEGWDEMRQLAHTYNAMVERLNASNNERDKAEENLLQLNQELEHRVTNRTADLQRANISLALKEEEMRSVVEHMVDCVVTTDEKGTILSANPVIGKLFGYSHNEVIGLNVSILMPEPDRSEHQNYMENYCRTGHGREYIGHSDFSGSHGIGLGREVVGISKNGERIELYLAVSEYFVGEKRHFTGIMRDIREHVRIMEDLKQARTEAEQANKAKSAFLAAMSHEIRTPMNGVIGMVDVLRQTNLSDYQLEMADLIRDSAYALLAIIEDILDFSKIEAGKLEIEKIPMRLSSVVENACGMLAHLALSKRVELTLFIDPAIPENVLGDPLRLRQVLVNIINNAIKFSSRPEKTGKVSVRVLLTESKPDKAVVTFQISDNGIGMSRDTQDKLFKSFSQGDASTTRRFGGTGLGLAISHHLTELMDAEIAVQSEPQHGSTFIIQMPFKPLPSTSDTSSRMDDLSGLHCLILADGDGLSSDLAIYLNSAGATVEQAADLTLIRQVIQNLAPGLWLVVIDAGREEMPSIEELRAEFAARSKALKDAAKTGPATLQTDVDPHFIIIRRGRRRQARIEDIDIVTLDGDVMYRQSLLRAMAIAAGRVGAREEKVHSADVLKSEIVPVLREEALQQGKLILIAEDNDINQKVIRQQLNLLGYTADITGDGREAYERWKIGNYALLITDLHMPEMDGFELAKKIRSTENEQKHIPIVALTANAMKGEKEHCLDVGMDDYLSKPAQLKDLRLVLEKHLPKNKFINKETELFAQPSTSTHESEPIIVPVDIHVLERLVGENDPEAIKEMLQYYRDSLEENVSDLRAAYEAERFVEVGSIAHKLKSSSRSVGALTLGEVCAEIEQAGKKDNKQLLAALLPSFDEEIIKVEKYLASLLYGEKI